MGRSGSEGRVTQRIALAGSVRKVEQGIAPAGRDRRGTRSIGLQWPDRKAMESSEMAWLGIDWQEGIGMARRRNGVQGSAQACNGRIGKYRLAAARGAMAWIARFLKPEGK